MPVRSSGRCDRVFRAWSWRAAGHLEIARRGVLFRSIRGLIVRRLLALSPDRLVLFASLLLWAWFDFAGHWLGSAQLVFAAEPGVEASVSTAGGTDSTIDALNLAGSSVNGSCPDPSNELEIPSPGAASTPARLGSSGWRKCARRYSGNAFGSTPRSLVISPASEARVLSGLSGRRCLRPWTACSATRRPGCFPRVGRWRALSRA